MSDTRGETVRAKRSRFVICRARRRREYDMGANVSLCDTQTATVGDE